MKLKKIVSSAIAAAMMGTIALTASATCLVPAENPEPGLNSDANSFLLQLYNEGNAEENRPATSYDIDYSKVAKYSVTVTVVDDGNRDLWGGNIGGVLVLSVNGGDITLYATDENGDPIIQTDENGDIVYRTQPVKDENGEFVYDENGERVVEFVLDENGEKIPQYVINPLWDKYNWSTQSFWGVDDDELGFEASDDYAIQAAKVGDYTYKLTSNEYANPLANGDAQKIGCMQIGFQEWGNEKNAAVKVTGVDVMDSSDNVLISFDGNGAVVVSTEPDPDKPDTSEPDTSEPDTSEPTTSEPTTSEPTTSEPTTSEPSTSEPTTSEPSTSEPTTSEPTTSEPTTSEPSTSEPAASEPDTSSAPDEVVEFVPEPVTDETVDEDTAKVIAEIKVSAPDAAFEAGTKLTVKKDTSVPDENAFALDITFTLNGSTVQPKDGASVTVSVPVPPMFKDIDESLLNVFHYLNGRYTKVEAVVKNGTVSFNTTHFSTYVISPENLEEKNTSDSEVSSLPTASATNPSTGAAATLVLPIAATSAAAVIIARKKRK